MEKKVCQIQKKIKSVVALVLTAALLVFTTVGCAGGKKSGPKDTIKLSVWVGDNCDALSEEAVQEFCARYPDQKFEITVSVEPENTCRTTVLRNIDLAADVYTFVDDQFADLYSGGALHEITENPDEVILACGGKNTAAVSAAMADGKLYAYPQSAGNTYYLYYNRSYLSEQDVESLEKILDVAAQNEKYFAMDFSSGWYLYSFFKAAGMDVTTQDNGFQNECDWNRTSGGITGREVTERLIEIASHAGFKSLTDEQMMDGFADGSVIAGVNGPWNAELLQTTLGKDFGCVKLPTYKVNNQNLQMCSFYGYKLVGVNAKSEYPEWAMRLAEYLTSESVDLKRFDVIGECPANVKAANSETVQASPVMAAIAAQSEFGYLQRIASPFWDATTMLGTVIASKNADGKDIQELLNTTVVLITQPQKEADDPSE